MKVEAHVVALWIGFELTAYGMGLVFLLLAVLWGLIALLVRLDNPPTAAEAEPAPGEASAASQRGAAAAPPALEPALLAAIVIACRAHRMARRKQAAPELRTHEPGSLPSRWVGSGRTRQNRSWAPGGRFA
jgi:Na+-transporting methylmalonyl-CoA/oxaloacetate decarboxylase gamma subunit